MSLSAIIFLFLLEAGAGSLLMLWILRRFELSISLRRFLAGLGGALAAAGLPFGMRACAPPQAGMLGQLLAPPILGALALLTACAAYLVLQAPGAAERGKALIPAAAVAGLIGIFAASGAVGPAPAAALRAGYFLTSTLLIGSTLGAMVLGHWYLVDRRMPIEPLRLASAILLFAATARIAVVAWPAARFWMERGAGTGAAEGEWLHLALLWTQRALFGLAGPMVLGLMVWQTVRLRATQAATGLLYIVLIFVIVGELTSHYLYMRTERLL
jgi:hypothetical protein